MKATSYFRLGLVIILALMLILSGEPNPAQAEQAKSIQKVYTTEDVPGLLERAGIPLENLRPQAESSTPDGSFPFDLAAPLEPTAAADPTYRWHTFYGAAGKQDYGFGIASDSSGIYILGESDGSWSGPMGETPLHDFNGLADFVVIKLDAAGAYQWHTFYGGLLRDLAGEIAIDNQAVYITGESESSWVGSAGQSPLHSYNNNGDILILKLDKAGFYQWHAFYGSDWTDIGAGVAVEGTEVYITGFSGHPWTGPAGQAPLNSFTSVTQNITVLKLDNAGIFQWHTFYGWVDSGSGIAVNGGLYITGISLQSWNGPDGQPPLNAFKQIEGTDIVVLKLDAAGAYQWHTFYGGYSGDQGENVAVDGAAVYIVGSSRNSWTGPSGQAPLHSHNGFNISNITVIKLNNAGAYQWHTFFGGNGGYYSDSGSGIVVNGGEVYITGYSEAAWSGPASQVPLNAHSGGKDIFILKLDINGAYQWHTFMGSSSAGDLGTGIVFTIGGPLVVGYGDSWFGPSDQIPLHANAGMYDVTVLKLNTAGAYQWHTFYGAGSKDYGYSVISDSNGTYISGETDASWDGPANQVPLHAFSGGTDIVVLKLDTNGVYQWHTFLGSTGTDNGRGIVADSSGLYISGESNTSWTGPSGQLPKHAHSGNGDFVVLKLDINGGYQWHTFYGSQSLDGGIGIALDSSGLFITGYSSTSWMGPTGQAPLHGHSGGIDLTVLKVDSAGAYLWHTFYGGGGSLIAVDHSGVYISGLSGASWNGPAGQAPLHAHSGDRDLVVLKLDGNGAYQWHTFYGSAALDHGLGIAAGSTGVYITGRSNALWTGPAGQAPMHAYNGGFDITALKLDTAGNYQWHTFFGSAADDTGFGITTDGSEVYIAGYSFALWTGSASQLPLHAFSGGYDIAVLKLNRLFISQFIPMVRK